MRTSGLLPKEQNDKLQNILLDELDIPAEIVSCIMGTIEGVWFKEQHRVLSEAEVEKYADEDAEPLKGD